MRTQYYTAASLDGFIATVDDSLTWLFPLGDVNETSYPQFITRVGALAMGAATYEWLWRHVIQPEAGAPGAWPYHQPTWVFSHRVLPGIPRVDIRFVQGDVRPVHAAMRAAAHGKNLWLVGGGELVGQFYDAGLLDDLIIQVASVTLGAGKPLLPRQMTSPSLRLVSVQQCGAGFAELRYEVQGRIARSGAGSAPQDEVWEASSCAQKAHGPLGHTTVTSVVTVYEPRSTVVRRRAFAQLVAEALDGLPRPLRRSMRNIVILVETTPSRALLETLALWPDHTLLGLYEGMPLPERGHGYGHVLPDRITIFQQPIEALCHTPEEMKDVVRETVIHEVGHSFGLDEARLEELMEQ